MATSSIPPEAYTSLTFKDISISHVPASSPTATKVVVLSLNRPEKYNAVTATMLIEMEAAYELFNKDERVRAIVLTGSGKAFCAGADLQVGFTGLLKSKQDEASIRAFRDQLSAFPTRDNPAGLTSRQQQRRPSRARHRQVHQAHHRCRQRTCGGPRGHHKPPRSHPSRLGQRQGRGALCATGSQHGVVQRLLSAAAARPL